MAPLMSGARIRVPLPVSKRRQTTQRVLCAFDVDHSIAAAISMASHNIGQRR